MAYINYAVFSVVGVGVCVILALIFKTYLHKAINQTDIFRIIICTLLGGVGAFITTFSRFQNYQGSIMAGLPIHRLDGFLRVFYSLIAGILVSLAIKGNVLAGFADSQQPWILYFFAMVAEASEILIPNLINQAEHQISSGTPPQPQTVVIATTDTATKAGVVLEKTNGQPQKEENNTPAKIDDAIREGDDLKKDDIPTSTTIVVTSQEHTSLNDEEKKQKP